MRMAWLALIILTLVPSAAYSQKKRKAVTATETVASLVPKQTYDKFSQTTTVSSANIDGWPGFWFGAQFSYDGMDRKEVIRQIQFTLILGSDFWPTVTINPSLKVLIDGKPFAFSQDVHYITSLGAAGHVFNTYGQSLTIREFQQLACSDITELQFAHRSFRFKPRDTVALRGLLFVSGNDCEHEIAPTPPASLTDAIRVQPIKP